MSLKNKTINNRSLDKSKRNNEKIFKKEKTTKPIKKIKLKLAKNIIQKHIKSNNIMNHGKLNTNANLDINKNNMGNHFKLINNNIKSNEIKKKILKKKINSPKTIKSPRSTIANNYMCSANKSNKKFIINQFNLNNLCNLNFNINNKKIILNINDNNKNTNNIKTNSNINTQNNIIHYRKINKTLTKIKNQKNKSQRSKNKNSQQKLKNKIENIIQNIYTNISVKTPINSPNNKRMKIPLGNLSQIIPQDVCNKIIKNNTHFKNSGQRPNKLVKKCQKSDMKPIKKMKKINLSSIKNLDMGNYLTKKNSRNKILQQPKLNNINNNGNIKNINNKKPLNDKKLEFKLSLQEFPQTSMYNHFLTNQTINITLSNCFNNSTINEKKEKMEGVKPTHRRYASINYPINNNNINNTNNYSNRIKKSKSKSKNIKISLFE